jgi:aspartate-semialdehyde dehydrogenase
LIVERPLLAVVGGESLLAREILELLNESKPAPRLQLISAVADGSAVITEVEEEAAVMLPLSGESLEGSQLAFLAGSASSSRRTLKVNPPSGPVLIDLSAALEELPEARLRAPSAEPSPPPGNTSIQVIAHPAAIALAMFFSRLAPRAPIRRSLVHVFEPASERGKQGLDELQQQTVAVLTFKKQKKDVFDAQLGFNLLARYGEEALEPLESVEQRLERHLASLLAAWPGIPMPSLRLIQAPVFHGHSFSIWVEFVESHGVKELARILSDAGLDVRPEDPPSNAGIAGQSGLSLGAIEEDRNHPRAVWFWVVADNLRLAAENAIAVSREFL